MLVGYLIGIFGINCAFYIFGVSVLGFICIALGTRVPSIVQVNEEEEPLISQRKGYYNYSPNAADADLNGLGRITSTASHANTLLIDNDENLLNLQRTATSTAARDVLEEADSLLEQMDSLPPLGLALSHIPTVDTSLAVFANIGDEHAEATNLKKIIFASPKVWTFLLMTLFFGIFYSMVAQFLFLFLQQDLQLEPSVIGWTGPIGGITEVSTFYVSRLVSYHDEFKLFFFLFYSPEHHF